MKKKLDKIERAEKAIWCTLLFVSGWFTAWGVWFLMEFVASR